MTSLPHNATASGSGDNPMPKNNQARRQSNLPKILSMMGEGNNTSSTTRKGSNSRDQRRQSNVFDAVDLTATLLAINHATVDLNATTSIDDDALKANIISKAVKKNSLVNQMVAIEELDDGSSDDSDGDVEKVMSRQEDFALSLHYPSLTLHNGLTESTDQRYIPILHSSHSHIILSNLSVHVSILHS